MSPKIPKLDPLTRKVWFGHYYGTSFGDMVLVDPEWVNWFLYESSFDLSSREDRRLVEALEEALEDD